MIRSLRTRDYCCLTLEEHKGIYSEVMKDLKHNLNRYKRFKATDIDEANKHFYEKVLPRERLEALSRISGIHYPNWGDRVRYEDGTLRIGANEYGSSVPVGLRWMQDWSWLSSRGGIGSRNAFTTRQITRSAKLKKYYVFKPQIIVTLRPIEIWQFLRQDAFMRRQGREGMGWDEKAILRNTRASELWKRAEVVPMAVILYQNGRTAPDEQAHSYKPGVVPNFKSRQFHEDPDHNEVAKTLKETHEMIDWLRDVAKDYWRL